MEGRSPWLKIVYLLLTVGAGFIIVGPALGFLLALPFYEGGMLELAESLTSNPTDPSLKIPLYIMQAGSTFIGLIVLPALQYWVSEKKSVWHMQEPQPVFPVMFALTTVIVLCFMVVNSVFIDWNANLKLPEYFKDIELWAREREDLAALITKFLTTFASSGEFILAFFVIAVLPGIGEEFVFRGLLQRQLHAATKNIHAAIWISAILFSAFHLQFFGFIPRILLGALFGYLYYWSGSLWISMFAHFFNNGFMVVMMYCNQLGIVELDIESTESAPWSVVMLFTILTFASLFYFKKFYQLRNKTSL